MSDIARKGLAAKGAAARADDQERSQVEAHRARAQQVERALQLASSSAEQSRAYEVNPTGYLQRLGIDTRGMSPPKLQLNRETLAGLSADSGNRYWSEGVTCTITATLNDNTQPMSSPPPKDPSATTCTITATVQTACP